jgi:hypothetical protein
LNNPTLAVKPIAIPFSNHKQNSTEQGFVSDELSDRTKTNPIGWACGN